jgi:hypothetical protein
MLYAYWVITAGCSCECYCFVLRVYCCRCTTATTALNTATAMQQCVYSMCCELALNWHAMLVQNTVAVATAATASDSTAASF